MIAAGYRRAAAVTPSDTADLHPAFTSKALFIGTAGALKVTTAGGDTLTFSNVPAGHLYLAVSRVWDTGTDASGIVLLGD
jgi:hypothetical protein